MLTRASFNFAARCNMGCRFCYIPFDGQEADYGVWRSVLERLVELGATQVSFGGGDPFAYREFTRLLSWSRESLKTLQVVHVDTNGLALSESDYDLVASTVDLIGLPLDGSLQRIHDAVRGGRSNFAQSIHHIRALAPRLPVKVNTLVCRPNSEDLPNIAALLRSEPPAIWALYEFWTLGDRAKRFSSRFALTREQYWQAVKFAESESGINVEFDPVDARAGAYFLVTQTGRAYATTGVLDHDYTELGSVFDDDVLPRWEACVDPLVNRERMDGRLRVLAEWSESDRRVVAIPPELAQ